MNTQMQYYALTTPTKWRAGYTTDGGGNRQEFYFDCADCGKECEIAGILSAGPQFNQIAVLSHTPPRLAMFCKECFQARIATPPTEPEPEIERPELPASSETANLPEMALA